MNEYYLHFIWKLKRLPLHQIRLVDGREFRLIDSGTYNEFENGPDFQNASIELDKLMWFGAIEMHVNASDWYLHRHHFDKRYDNVILHVVFNNDREIYQNERLLPTIELKNWIDEAHFRKYQYLKNESSIPCKNQLVSVPKEYFENMKTRAMLLRLERKMETKGSDQNSLLLLFIARSFGANVNQEPFEQLAQSIQWNFREQLTKEEFKSYVLELAFSDTSLLSHQWSTKGNRFVSNANKRVSEFASFTYDLDSKFEFSKWSTQEILSFFKNKFELLGLKKEKMLLKNLFINAIVPFLFTIGRSKNDLELEDKAIDLLMSIDKEENTIVRKWKELGISCKNAFDSQAVLEIYKQFCSRKQCLNCTVGIKLLNQ